MSKKTNVDQDFKNPEVMIKVSKKFETLSKNMPIRIGILSKEAISGREIPKGVKINDFQKEIGILLRDELKAIFGDRVTVTGERAGTRYSLTLAEGETVESIVNGFYGVRVPTAPQQKATTMKSFSDLSQVKETLLNEEEAKKEEAKKKVKDRVDSDPNYRLSNVDNHNHKAILTLMVLDILAENNSKMVLPELEKEFSKRSLSVFKVENPLYINQIKKVIEIFRPEYEEQLVETRLQSPTDKYNYRVRQVRIVRPMSLIMLIAKSLLAADFTDDLRAGDRTYVFGLHEKYHDLVPAETEKYRKELENKKLEAEKLKMQPVKAPALEKDNNDDALRKQANKDFRETPKKPVRSGLAGAMMGLGSAASKVGNTIDTAVVTKTVELIPDSVLKTNKELFAKFAVVCEIISKGYKSLIEINSAAEKQYFIGLSKDDITNILKKLGSMNTGLKQNGITMMLETIPEGYEISKTSRTCLLQTVLGSEIAFEVFGKDNVKVLTEGLYLIHLDYSIESSKKLCSFYYKAEFNSLLDEELSILVGFGVIDAQKKVEEQQEAIKREYEEKMAKMKEEAMNSLFA